MTLNEVFEIFKTLSLTSQLWPQKPEALFTEYFFHFADFPFHFAGDLFCCATVLQIAVSNGFSGLFFDLARNFFCRALYFVCCARVHNVDSLCLSPTVGSFPGAVRLKLSPSA